MKKLHPVFFWVGLGLLATLLYGYRLGFPPQKIFDEVYQVTTAQQFLGLNGYTETSHPPFGETLMAFFLMVLGDHPWVWRLTSLLSGWASLAIVYCLAKKLTGDSLIARWSVFLYALDGVSLVMSRIGMIHAPMLALMLLSVLALFPYGVEGLPVRRQAFFASGALWGLAFGIRWMAAGILGLLIVLISFRWREEKEKLTLASDFILFFVLAALLSYLAAYTTLHFLKGYRWTDIGWHQKLMMHYHLNLKTGHRYASQWWGWPFLLRPIWFYFNRGHGLVNGILCIGNPAIFWMIPISMGFVLWSFLKQRSKTAAFILTGFFVQWFPCGFIQRVTFFHYIYPLLPFVAIASALFLARLWKTNTAGKTLVVGYLMLVTALFIYWYPLLTGFPISEKYFRHHLWFKSWV